MFTGIIEELGEVVAIDHLADSATLTVRGPLVTSDAAHGSSICVNGVCLTVTALADDRLYNVGAALEAALLDRWGHPLLQEAPVR